MAEAKRNSGTRSQKETVAHPLTAGPIVTTPSAPISAPFVMMFVDEGVVDIDRVAEALRMSKEQLKTQTRIIEMLEIISRVRDMSGGQIQAMAWYRSQPLPALDGRTAEVLVKLGRASAVRAYLDDVDVGGFA